MSRHDQETQPWPNAANLVREYLEKRWGGFLLKTHYAWFTGSTVWALMYGLRPDLDADLDMFIELPDGMRNAMFRQETTAAIAQDRPVDMNYLYNCAPVKWIESHIKDSPAYVAINKNGSIGGRRYATPQGQLDYWVCSSDVFSQLMNYPHNSHGHCKAAFSFYRNALVIMPNNLVTAQGRIETAERQMLQAALEAK